MIADDLAKHFWALIFFKRTDVVLQFDGTPKEPSQSMARTSSLTKTNKNRDDHVIKLFLAGDVMLGRGVDQILPRPCDPKLYEFQASSALDYVRLAERRSGPIARPVPFGYVWGEGIAELRRQQPDVRLINLETAITRSGAAEPKGINYRMSPQNVEALTAAKIQACVLANNHVMDWG